MIKHVVCFKLKDGESPEKAKEVLLSMQGNVPMLKGIEVGVDELKSNININERKREIATLMVLGYHDKEVSGYIFRGENVDNYIKLDNKLYRIIKIDGNSDFMIIKDIIVINILWILLILMNKVQVMV